MIRALLLAFSQLSERGSRRVVWTGVLGSLAIFAGLAALIWWALFHTTLTDIGWLDTALDLLGGVLVLLLAWILFPAGVTTVAGFLLDDVVDAVERRYYPHLPPARSPGITQEVWTALRFLSVVILVNLVALPLYLTLPGLNLIVFYLVNGYLLGREYFELVAIRRVGRAAAKDLRRAFPLRLFSAGVIIAFLSTLPLVNLLVPVVASAFMAHVFHGMKAPLRAAE